MQRALRADLVIARRASFGFANKILREVLYQGVPEPVRLNRHRRAASCSPGSPKRRRRSGPPPARGPRRSTPGAPPPSRRTARLATPRPNGCSPLPRRRLRTWSNPALLAEILIRRGQIRSDLGSYRVRARRPRCARSASPESSWTRRSRRARSNSSGGPRCSPVTRSPPPTSPRSRPSSPRMPRQRRPHRRSAFLLLGRVRHWDGDYEGATNAYAQVIAERPDDEIAAQALTFRGAVLQHVDRFAEARRILTEAIVLCRSNGLFRPLLQALFFTALSLGDSGDFVARAASPATGASVDRRQLDHLLPRRHRHDNVVAAEGDSATSPKPASIADRAVEEAERGGGALELEQGLHAVLAVAECELSAGRFDDAGRTRRVGVAVSRSAAAIQGPRAHAAGRDAGPLRAGPRRGTARAGAHTLLAQVPGAGDVAPRLARRSGPDRRARSVRISCSRRSARRTRHGLRSRASPRCCPRRTRSGS